MVAEKAPSTAEKLRFAPRDATGKGKAQEAPALVATAPSDRFWMGALFILVISIVLRQVQLGQAPFYPDENIHTFFSQGFSTYSYNPTFHGPLLYHLVAGVFSAFGQYDYTARLVPSLLGIGLIALVLGPARTWMGERASLAAAALLAVSPSVVTYSRHLLHDALALDLTMGAVLCFVTALHYPAGQKRGRRALLGLAACLSLFLATKANFFFLLVVIVAFWFTWKFPRRFAPALVVAVGAAALLWKSALWSGLWVSIGFVGLGHLPASVAAILALLAVAAPAFYLAWRFLPALPELRGCWWPAVLFALLTVAAVVYPRDNSLADPIKDNQHLIFQRVAILTCGVFWYWLWSRRPDEREVAGRVRWKGHNDWAAWVLSLAVAVWIYVFSFGQGAQIIEQWATAHPAATAITAPNTSDSRQIESQGQTPNGLSKWVAAHSFPKETFLSGQESARNAIPKMLEYWGGQQARPRLGGRHDYYLVLGLLYEIPILIAAMGGIWHATRNRSVWSDFLLWWAFASWAVYAIANEKVPWLWVHLALPLALLGALWIASLHWKRSLFFAATMAGLFFSLRGDAAMIFERAGDNAEPLLYAQTPDAFRDAIQSALAQTRGDTRPVWVNGERQWPSLWYLREKGNPPMGHSTVSLGGAFEPDKYRAFVAMDNDLAKWTDRQGWRLQTVDFLIWPRASWEALQPARYWRWFWTRRTIERSEYDGGPAKSPTSILAGHGEWSYQPTTIGSRVER